MPQGFAGYVYNWCPNLGSRYTPMRTPRYVETQARRLADNHVRSIYRDGFGALFGLEGPVYYAMGRMFDDPANNRAKKWSVKTRASSSQTTAAMERLRRSAGAAR